MLDLLTQLVVAFAAAVLAQIGGPGEAATHEPPSVQRTALRADPAPAPRAIPTRECDEEARLHDA